MGKEDPVLYSSRDLVKNPITKEEYRRGVESGEILHVRDTRDGQVKIMKRDGYYPPEVLRNLRRLG